MSNKILRSVFPQAMSVDGGVKWMSRMGAMAQEGDRMDETKRDSPEDLHEFAKALVGELIRRHQLEWDEHRYEDGVLVHRPSWGWRWGVPGRLRVRGEVD